MILRRLRIQSLFVFRFDRNDHRLSLLGFFRHRKLLLMRMLNASYPDKQEYCLQSDFREVTIGQTDLAHLTHLGYEHRDYKAISVHQILREIRSHKHYVREQRLTNEAVQVRVPRVQRERELAEQRSQREAVAMIGVSCSMGAGASGGAGA